jgi:hypothetical protein
MASKATVWKLYLALSPELSYDKAHPLFPQICARAGAFTIPLGCLFPCIFHWPLVGLYNI